jgi:hypothetical protein
MFNIVYMHSSIDSMYLFVIKTWVLENATENHKSACETDPDCMPNPLRTLLPHGPLLQTAAPTNWAPAIPSQRRRLPCDRVYM